VKSASPEAHNGYKPIAKTKHILEDGPLWTDTGGLMDYT
jgi:hypothetical protein